VLPVASLSVERQSVFHAALRLIELPESFRKTRTWKGIEKGSHGACQSLSVENSPAQQAIK